MRAVGSKICVEIKHFQSFLMSKNDEKEVTEERYCFVMEKMDGSLGDLSKYIHKLYNGKPADEL